MNEPRCIVCGKPEYADGYMKHAFNHDFSPSEPEVGPLGHCESLHGDILHIHITEGLNPCVNWRAEAVAPEPPLCPVCKVTPMMRDAGGDWECPNRTVGGPHSRFATGEVREAPEPKPDKALNTSHKIFTYLQDCRFSGRPYSIKEVAQIIRGDWEP